MGDVPIGEVLCNMAKKGAQIKNLGPMCNDCAFRPGTDPNNDEITMGIVEGQLLWEGQFNCHITDAPDHNQACIGFLYATQYLESLSQSD